MCEYFKDVRCDVKNYSFPFVILTHCMISHINVNVYILPMYIHFLRRLYGFVIRNFGRHSQHYDEGYDPTGDVDSCVGLIHARIVRFAGRDRRRGSRLHPHWCLVILAGFLIQPVFLILAAEA